MYPPFYQYVHNYVFINSAKICIFRNKKIFFSLFRDKLVNSILKAGNTYVELGYSVFCAF